MDAYAALSGWAKGPGAGGDLLTTPPHFPDLRIGAGFGRSPISFPDHLGHVGQT